MSAPLHNNQKAYLAQLARRAWNLQNARARGDGSHFALPTSDFNKWRHDQVALAVGKLGLRCCSQDDYKLVEAHFLNLLGETGKAMNALMRAQSEARRVIEHKIVQECAAAGFHISYANKICVAQNRGAGLDAVDERALWKVFYTVRNRGLKKKREAALAPSVP